MQNPLDFIAGPLGGWSCNYFYVLTVISFVFGMFLFVMSILRPSKNGLFLGMVLTVTPMVVAYFNARILYSVCDASIGRGRVRGAPAA